MSYPAPAGTDLIKNIGTGSIFHVALVREGGRALICKRLTTRVMHEPAARAAIVREAKALSLANHPALPALVRVGSDAHGPFLLETRIEGVSLRALVEGWRARGRHVPPRLVAHLLRASVEALAEVHELVDKGGPLEIVHGDLGPEHVILGPLGDVRFVDLGAARFRGMEGTLVTEDRGTLPFVAPEVARGEASPSVAGDVYALSAALLFLVSGGPICHARDEAAMLVEVGDRGVRVELLEQAPSLSPAERSALRSALEVDPTVRTKVARALLAELDAPSIGR